MRILQIINGLAIGGAEKIIIDTIPLLVEKGVQMDVLLLNGEKTPFSKELKMSGKCIIYKLGNAYYNPLYIYKIIPYLKRYDLVHVHLFPSLYFTAIAKYLSFSRIKLIFTEHNTSNRRIHNEKIRWLERFVYSQYDGIVCITAEVKQVLNTVLKISNEKLHTIHNGINIDKIQKANGYDKLSFGYMEGDILLIMVAGFRAQKDHDTVIKALHELPENYKLVLVGDGDRRSQIEHLVTSLNLQNRVNLLGVRNDVYSLIKMCDIAILSSHWEGFGLAAAEAMVCGVPLIASNVDGLAQVVGNGGVLFEKGDVNHLIEEIKKINNEQYKHNLIARGISKAKHYDISLMVDKLLDLYHKI